MEKALGRIIEKISKRYSKDILDVACGKSVNTSRIVLLGRLQ